MLNQITLWKKLYKIDDWLKTNIIFQKIYKREIVEEEKKGNGDERRKKSEPREIQKRQRQIWNNVKSDQLDRFFDFVTRL